MAKLWTFIIHVVNVIRSYLTNKKAVGTSEQLSSTSPIPSSSSSEKKSEPSTSATNASQEKQKRRDQKEADFISALPIAVAEGFDPLIPFVQAIHETADFTRMVGDYNFWGIKVPKDWQGKTVKVRTHEYINGEKVYLDDYFIDFISSKDALEFWIYMIKKFRHYKDAWKRRHDYKRFYRKLVDTDEPGEMGWATDPAYATKLIKLYPKIRDSRGGKIKKALESSGQTG